MLYKGSLLDISLYIANSLETELFIGFYKEYAVFWLFLIYFAICLGYGTWQEWYAAKKWKGGSIMSRPTEFIKVNFKSIFLN